MDSEILKNSVVSMRQKVVPETISQTHISTEDGNILETHTAYDFLGLNFKDRTGRQNLEMNKKVQTIMEYAKENSDDPISFLRQLEGKLGARPMDISLLEHLYHAVKFRNTAEEKVPVEERKSTYTTKAKEALSLIENLKSQMKTAKETAQLSKQLAKIEERQKIYLKKLEKLNGKLQTGNAL